MLFAKDFDPLLGIRLQIQLLKHSGSSVEGSYVLQQLLWFHTKKIGLALWSSDSFDLVTFRSVIQQAG